MVQLGTSSTSEPIPAANAPAGPIVLTEKALKMVKLTREQEGMSDDVGLRIAVRGGGCSGFEYAIDFEKAARDTDTVLAYDGSLLRCTAIWIRPSVQRCWCASPIGVRVC